MSDTSGIRIVQTVASGGTAVLYKAVQTSLDRVVAVKRLHAHLTGDANFTRRFILEAKAAASLDHPNIVHVIDFGERDGQYEMVMEFVEGESLKEILERWRPVRWDLALAVAHQVLQGLEHAHARGIVHRDIKPGNVMLTQAGRVKITDFGLAKLTQAASSHTAENSILGTPLYMSPEQAFGESVDQRSDLFSLGTMLYEMVTGRQPFASENYMGVIRNILRADVPRPRSIISELAPEVEALILRALARDRERRFQSAREFREAIEAVLGRDALDDARSRLGALLERDVHTRVMPRPDVTPPRARRRRSRRGAAAAAVLLLAAGATALAVLRPDLVPGTGGPRADAAGEVHASRPADAAPQVSDVAGVLDLPVAALLGDSAAPPAGADTTSGARPTRPDARRAGGPGETGAGEGFRGGATVEAARGSGADRSGPPPPAPTAAGAGGPAAASLRTVTDEAGAKAAEPGEGDDDHATAARSAPAQAKRPRRAAPHTGFLLVDAGTTAELWVDGVYRGDVPPAQRMELPAGRHEVECRRPGYVPYRETIRIVTGELSQRHVTLQRQHGRVVLVTEPGATLFVDGRPAGVTPLAAPIELEAGVHTLTLRKGGFHTWHSSVTVQPDETMTLRIALSPRY